MELGEKIRQARQEAGLSQRQLCGDVITRNMLSQIENGSAQPSMDTLRFLADQLGKSVSFFLEEDAVASSNVQVMQDARKALDRGQWDDVLAALKMYRRPDELFDRERAYIVAIATLELAEEGLKRGKTLYARQLLEEVEMPAGAGSDGLARRRLLLLGKCAPEKLENICRELPGLDEELMLRARGALEQRDYIRAEQLLDAVEDQMSMEWNLLRGEIHLVRRQFAKAAVCYLNAETLFPGECWPKLERCYRELGDFQKAYEYASKQKSPS